MGVALRRAFSKEEYDRRIGEIQTLMAQSGMDGLLATQAENLIYFSGYRTGLYNSKFRPFFCLIPAEGNPVLILPALELGLGRQTSYIEDIRCWGSTPGSRGNSPVRLMAETIKERHSKKVRLGIELDNGQRMGMNMAQYEELKGLLPNVEFVSSSSLIWSLRSVKSPVEIEYMREACRIADRAMEAAAETAREGCTEKEIAMAMGVAIMKEGADFPRSLSISSGPGSYDILNGLSTDRVLKKGDMVNIDYGTLYRGYCSDITRSLFIGTPTKRQREFYEASRQAQEEACRAVKPGIPVSEVDRITERVIIELGYREYMLHRTGHSLGLEVHELPSIGPDDPTVLKEGMVLAIEPGIYDFSIGAFRVEDNIVVTRSGSEHLNQWPRDIIVK